MVRRRGSMAPSPARRCDIRLPGCSLECTTCRIPTSLWMCSSSCWDARDRLGSCRVGFRPGLCRSSAPARRRASREWHDVLSAWTSHWAGCQGAKVGCRARWLWCGRVCDAGTIRGRWRGPVVAEHGLHALLSGGSHCQMVRTGFWRQMVVSWFDSGGWRNNASLGQNLQLCIGWQHNRASTDILMHRLGDTCARAYYLSLIHI